MAIKIRILLSSLSLVVIAACQRAEAPRAPEAPPGEALAGNGIELTAEDSSKLGIETAPAAAMTFVTEAQGYGVVLGHDAIAQTVADVTTAQAAARQSQAALARVKSLADTPGAFSAETFETAERQAKADDAALMLARRKLSAMWGAGSPWKEDEDSAVLREVASGRTKLTRATFPLGVLPAPEPKTLRFAHLGRQNDAKRRQSDVVWEAPADMAIPGRSLFALLQRSDVSEGERLDVRAPLTAPIAGVLIPHAAVVMGEGQYWCYVEEQPGHFARRAIDANRPTDDGYFIEQGVRTGEAIVVAGAGLLLARETSPRTAAD